MWPLVAAVGGVLVVVGLVTYPVVFIFGIIALLAAAVEWMVQAWSERASADVAFNADVRGRIAHPLEFPILAAVGVGIIIYSFSRIMLFLSKTERAGGVRRDRRARSSLVGFVVAFRPSLRSGADRRASPSIAALGLVAGGVAAALEGERELHPHETTGDLAAEGECDTPEETEADEHASQTVAAKANLAGRGRSCARTARSSPRTSASTGDQDTLVVTRANPTNVLFRNESDEDRRLVLDLGTRPELDEDGRRRSPTPRCPNQLLHAARRGRRQPVADVLDRRRRARSPTSPYRVRRARRRRRRGRGGRAVSATVR